MPVWKGLANDPGDVISCIDYAHRQSQAGRFVLGYVAYEAAPAFDSFLPVRQTDCQFPLVCWMAFERGQVQELPIQADELPAVDPFSPWREMFGEEWFNKSFLEVKGLIEQGEFYQINLTTRLKSRAPEGFSAWSLFKRLLIAQPAAHSVYLDVGDFQVLSLSPELFFSWDGRALVTSPMKGTRKPGRDQGLELQDNPKDRAENLMIVDLLRNDMSRVCEPRSVQVKSLFDVVRLPTVEQMTSTIEGITRSGTELGDIFKALFPCGSVTGAPKRQAMRHIATFESEQRGVYCGAMGVMQPGGAVKMNVPIRTVTLRNGQMSYGVGSGLTWYSDRQAERKEWWQKTQFLRGATKDFQVLETLALKEGVWVRLTEHLLRMKSAACHFGFVWDQDEVIRQVKREAMTRPNGQWRGRLLLSAQGELQVFLDALPAEPAVVEVRLADSAINPDDDWVQFKTTHRTNYDFFAPRENGVFDTLLFDPKGQLTETCRFNVVFQIENQYLTPRMSTCGAVNLLGGVLRGCLLSENEIFEADLTVSDLARVQRAWLINSLRGWIEIHRIADSEGKLLYQVAK